MDRQFKPPRYAGGPDFLPWFSQVGWALMSTPGCVNIWTDGNLANAPPGEPDHGDDYPMDDQIFSMLGRRTDVAAKSLRYIKQEYGGMDLPHPIESRMAST
eukprot:gene4806-34560_t